MSKKTKKTDILFFALLALTLCLLIYKAPYGFGQNDESFYLTVPYRMAQGDTLLADEWHPSQLTGFLLYPALKLYLAITGTTEGIILSFRFIFSAVQILASLFFYYQARKYSAIGAAIASLVFTLYAPFNLMALSYNSLGLILLMSSCVMILNCDNWGKRFASGILFAGAVLCCPYLLLMYLVYSAVFVVARVKQKKHVREWLCFTAGAASLAAVFLGYIFTRVTIDAVIEGIRQLFLDPEHVSGSGNGLLAYFRALYGAHPFSIYIFSGIALLTVIIVLDKDKFGARRLLYSVLSAAITAIYYGNFVVAGYVNYLMYPLTIMGWFAYLLSINPMKKKWLIWMFIPGLLYGMLICLGSNQGYYVISSAATISSMASIMMIANLVGEIVKKSEYKAQMKNKAFFAAGVLSALLVFQIGIETHYRLTYTFGDNFPNMLEQYLPKDRKKVLLLRRKTLIATKPYLQIPRK